MLAAAGGGGGDAGPAGRREALERLGELAGSPPTPDVSITEMQAPGGDGAPRPMRRYAPEGREPTGRLLYLHGGGWTGGSLDTHAGVCAALAAEAGCEVFALDYRLAPEHPCPAAIEDAVAALDFLRREAVERGLDPDRVAIGGDSAGANVVAASCLELRRRGRPQPAAQLLLCPILDPDVDTRPSRRDFREGLFIDPRQLAEDFAAYRGPEVAPDDPRAAPLRADDLQGLAPAFIHAAEFDPFRDEAVDYAARLTAAGVKARVVVHPGMIHYFYALGRMIPRGRAAVAAAGADLRDAFARP